MKIYCFHNLMVGFYTAPSFETISPDEKVEQIRRFCLTNKGEALKLHMDECVLVYLGEFNDTECTWNLTQPKPIANLGAFFPKAEVAPDA